MALRFDNERDRLALAVKEVSEDLIKMIENSNLKKTETRFEIEVKYLGCEIAIFCNSEERT